MYQWNTQYINTLIKKLETFKKENTINCDKYMLEKNKLIKEDIKTLKYLKNILINFSPEYKDNIKFEYEDYKNIRQYNYIINTIIKKYEDEHVNDINFNKIKTSKKDIITFTRDNINQINKKWAQTLEPWLLSNYHINFKHNNNDFIIPLKSVNTYFISLSKNNNICDFIIPTHEFLHIYGGILNHNTFKSIDNEFLSLLGELITAYEMKNNNLHKDEVIKYEIDNIYRVFEYILDINLRKKIIKYNKENNTTIYNNYKDYGITKKYIKTLYNTNITYDYITIISFFIALELFEIYKVDKEKCIYITENIIKSNDKLSTKLKTNNIKLLNNDNYIKQLKKEYEIINNQ